METLSRQSSYIPVEEYYIVHGASSYICCVATFLQDRRHFGEKSTSTVIYPFFLI